MGRDYDHAANLPRSTPLLSSAEERELVAIKDSMVLAPEVRDQARNRLVTSNILLIPAILKRVPIPQRYFDGFCSHLLFELISAVEHYRAGRGAVLSTFITKCLWCQARNYVRKHELVIHVPNNVMYMAKAFGRPRDLKNLQAAATAFETVTVGNLRVAETYNPGMLWGREPSPQANLETRERDQRLRDTLRRLSPLDRTILQEFYCLDGRPNSSDTMIGQRLGVSRQRVHTLRAAALRRLKVQFELRA